MTKKVLTKFVRVAFIGERWTTLIFCIERIRSVAGTGCSGSVAGAPS
jgi:hypothetical protein